MKKFFKKNFRKIYLIIAFFILSLILLSPIFIATNNDVFLNQFFLQKTWIKQGDFSEIPVFLKSAYPFGLKLLFDKDLTIVDINDTSNVLDYLFNNIPSNAYVYPTETYYYYKFPFEGKTYAGNLRLLDAREGKLHIGYYDVDEPHGQVHYSVLDGSDGVEIKSIDKYNYEVTYKGMRKVFHLTSMASQQPKSLNMLPEEEFIAHIIDESGIIFFLLYNNETASFYYILDEEQSLGDTFYFLNGFYLIGERTKYIFYKDDEYKRKLLVGVYQKNIYLNN